MLTGRCACKTVTYAVADEFVVAYNCHCSNCRAMTGSAFLPWGEIEPEKLRVTNGEDSLILDGDPHSHHAKRCGKCFSLVYWTGYGGKIRVPYGSLSEEPSLKPMAHMFVGSKAPWYEIRDDLPPHDDTPGPTSELAKSRDCRTGLTAIVHQSRAPPRLSLAAKAARTPA